MFIPLKNPLPDGTVVHFEFPIEGKCPEGGTYSGNCYVTYHPYDKLVNVASFAKWFTKSTSYAELHALSIYNHLGRLLDPFSYVKVCVFITEADDHGPLEIKLKGKPHG